MEELKQLCENIKYLPASEKPLSADVILIETPDFICVYDVGSSEKARSVIENITKKKIVVLSHFHTDHTANLSRITFDELYAGKETVRYTKAGIVVNQELCLSLLRIMPIPSVHAKGSILLCYGEYAFCGDACYCAAKNGRPFYNAQLLKAQINLLCGLEVKYLALSHKEGLLCSKEEVVCELKKIYATRNKDSSEIWLE